MSYVNKLAAFLAANPAGTAQAFAEYLDQASAKAVTGAPKRPKAGTLTGKVWELCDTLYGQDPKVFTRKLVVEAGRAAGLNDATITTQYQAWRTAQAAAAKAAQAQAEAEAAEAVQAS